MWERSELWLGRFRLRLKLDIADVARVRCKGCSKRTGEATIIENGGHCPACNFDIGFGRFKYHFNSREVTIDLSNDEQYRLYNIAKENQIHPMALIGIAIKRSIYSWIDDPELVRKDAMLVKLAGSENVS